MNNKKHLLSCLSIASIILFSTACSPIKSSPKEEGYQMELSLHEVQTNMDDLRHDIHSFETELHILDGKIKYQESTLENLKQQTLDKVEIKLETLSKQIAALEKRELACEKSTEKALLAMEKIGGHASEEATALAQYKERLRELEKSLLSQEKRFEEISKLKGTLDVIAKSMDAKSDSTYKVKSGDSLEKIAKLHGVNIDALKRANNLRGDRIIAGQELQIPE